MAVDTIPLGWPELGMTRAEILVHVNSLHGHYANANEMFYTLLFAYVVAMYLAGSQLTRAQYTIVNVMYLVVMAGTVTSAFGYYAVAVNWLPHTGLERVSAISVYMPIMFVMVSSLLVFLSIWFGRKVRHSNTE